MKMISLQIKEALCHGAPYAALVTALTVPEICGRASREQPTSGQSLKIYADWYDEYVGQCNVLTGSECYYLRCGLLHHGESKKERKMAYDRVAFVIPGRANGHIHAVVSGGIVTPGPRNLMLDLVEFCRSICAGAETWQKSLRSDGYECRNLENLVQFRPDGYGNLGNVPVIA